MIKKLLIAVGALCMFFSSAAFADYEEFVNSLSKVQVDSDAIASSQTISRYDVAKLLNFIDCNDCHRPTNDYIQRLTSPWWSTFRALPSANFDDVNYNSSLESSNNYYCVAYVAEQ